jgi:hypothetical protein
MTGRIPDDSWEGAVKFLNTLDWNLSTVGDNGKWSLYGGDQRIFSSDSEGELETFVLGMTLGLVVLPDDFLDQLRTLIR